MQMHINIGGGITAFLCKWNNRLGKVCERKWLRVDKYSKITRKKHNKIIEQKLDVECSDQPRY